MTEYHDDEKAIPESAKSLIKAGLNGTLEVRMIPYGDIVPLGIMDKFNLEYLNRSAYCQKVSWAVYTAQYIQTLKGLLFKLTGQEEPSVLEVCAGRGVLEKHFSNWVCTDAEPAALHVIKKNAIKAIEEFEFDVLFVSWIPYRSTLDMTIANICQDKNIPLILVGEELGCTGSEEFWKSDYNDKLLNLNHFGFSFEDDVAQWPGIHDCTNVLI